MVVRLSRHSQIIPSSRSQRSPSPSPSVSDCPTLDANTQLSHASAMPSASESVSGARHCPAWQYRTPHGPPTAHASPSARTTARVVAADEQPLNDTEYVPAAATVAFGIE